MFTLYRQTCNAIYWNSDKSYVFCNSLSFQQVSADVCMSMVHAFNCTIVESSKLKLSIVVRLKWFQKNLQVTLCITSQKFFVQMTETCWVFLLELPRLNAGSAQSRWQFVPSIFFLTPKHHVCSHRGGCAAEHIR